MSDDAARAAILRRRAFFVGSALTALTGCPSQHGPAGEPTPVVGVEPVASSTSAVATTSAAVPPAPNRKRPSLAIPNDAKDVVLSHYQRLARDVPAIHDKLDEAAAALSGICDITDPQCDSAWLAVARALAAADRDIQELPPHCPATSKEGKAYEERLQDHVNFAMDRRNALQTRIDALLSSAKAKSQWQVHIDAATEPQPCLDFHCQDW
jgi:hypothetical protein